MIPRLSSNPVSFAAGNVRNEYDNNTARLKALTQSGGRMQTNVPVASTSNSTPIPMQGNGQKLNYLA